MGLNQLEWRLPFMAHRSKDLANTWVSYSPENDLVSQGRSFKEATVSIVDSLIMVCRDSVKRRGSWNFYERNRAPRDVWEEYWELCLNGTILAPGETPPAETVIYSVAGTIAITAKVSVMGLPVFEGAYSFETYGLE